MARIKVTGYLDTAMMAPEDLDFSHATGLSASGYEIWSDRFGELDDRDFELER